MTYLATATRVFADEIGTLNKLKSCLDQGFNQACDVLMACQGKVVVCGMGKSGHIANKIAATLASTGTPAFFMHPGEANHGDLGMLSAQDVFIAISNSGETTELLGLLPVIKRQNIPIICVTNNVNSALAQHADVVLALHVENEACSLGLAPTSSTTATLVLGDALAIALLEAKGFTANDFALSHPGGALGKRLLLRVTDVMLRGDELPLTQQSASVREALLDMSAKGLGMTGIVDHEQRLVGVFTDGDLRRALDKGIDINQESVQAVMTQNSVSIAPQQMAVEALNLMQSRKISALFVLENGFPIGAVKMHDLLKEGVV